MIGNLMIRKFLIPLIVLTLNIFNYVNYAKSMQVRNSERMTISLGNLEDNIDDLEMIPENKNRDSVNKKMEKFHDFVKNTKVMKHPWKNFFISREEYRKSDDAYRKITDRAIAKVKESNVERPCISGLNLLKILHFNKGPKTKDKRHLSNVENLIEKNDYVGEINSNYDDDDDDEDEDESNPIKSAYMPISQYPDFLKQEYEKQIIDEEVRKKAFKYSDKGKPEENFKDAFDKIVDTKLPHNCTNITGFGIKSVKCLLHNYKIHKMTGKQAFIKFMKMFLIWVDIYLGIAIPLWCIKGWGSFCIPWKYCHPDQLVKEVQKYVAENPPGVYINQKGEEEHYAPTLTEKELYDKINKKILHM